MAEKFNIDLSLLSFLISVFNLFQKADRAKAKSRNLHQVSRFVVAKTLKTHGPQFCRFVKRPATALINENPS
jgi:DNA polymerase III delta subunit